MSIQRPGNVHSAEAWRDQLESVVARYRDTMKRRYFRADAAFAAPEVYEFLEPVRKLGGSRSGDVERVSWWA